MKIALDGWGFSENDKIRLIDNEKTCLDKDTEDGGPRGATGFMIDCPGSCQEVGADPPTDIVAYVRPLDSHHGRNARWRWWHVNAMRLVCVPRRRADLLPEPQIDHKIRRQLLRRDECVQR